MRCQTPAPPRSLLQPSRAAGLVEPREREVDSGLLDLLGIVHEPRTDVILDALEVLSLRDRIIRREARPDHEVQAAKDELFCCSGHGRIPLHLAATGASRATRCQRRYRKAQSYRPCQLQE